MEYCHRRVQTQTFPLRRSSTVVKFEILDNMASSFLQSSQQKSQRTRPTTTKSKRSGFSAFSDKKTTTKTNKRRSDSYSKDLMEFLELLKKTENRKIYRLEPVNTQLSLCQNQSIFQEDVYKLQNLITGGYSCQDEFMSISKFNNSKDNFILLNQIYEKAKLTSRPKRLRKQPIKQRNIFSIIYLNQNLERMGKKQTQEIFKNLKIVR